MGKNQESPRLGGDTTSPVPADLSGSPEPLAQPVTTERRLYIVHSHNNEEGTGLGFNGLGPGSRRGRGMLDRAQQARLGKLLRAIFSDTEEEVVPERFVKLLEALEAREKKALEAKASEAPGTAGPETREKSGA
jgi:hypothetical protein